MSKGIKVGQTYLCKVGRNQVEVKVLNTCDGGWEVETSAGKRLTIKDAERLTAAPKAEGTPQGATVARKHATAGKSATPAAGSDTSQQGANEGKKKRTSLMDAAAKVVAEADQADLPMSATKMVEIAQAKGYWSPSKGGKTPANTLYAMILRDMTKHGGDAKFRRAEDHFGKGRFFLNR